MQKPMDPTSWLKGLPKSDYALQLHLDEDKKRPFLTVIRDGNTKCLPISRAVAEELIAHGMSFGT